MADSVFVGSFSQGSCRPGPPEKKQKRIIIHMGNIITKYMIYITDTVKRCGSSWKL